MNDVDMAESNNEFVLSRVVAAHKGDVKAVQVTSAGTVITGSRDETVKFWTKRAGEYNETVSFVQPKGLVVNSVAYYECEQGWRLFVGRKDGSIAVYGTGSSEPIVVRHEHTSNVCCLYADNKNNVLLSGSWDNSVIVWPINEIEGAEFAALKLMGHTLSVWALAAIDNSPGTYLTGSADKSIILWQGDVEVLKFQGHKDVVRALLVLDDDRFISAANDATLKLWHLRTGVCLGTFQSFRDDFIFSLCRVNDLIVSCGDHGNIEIWNRKDVDGQLSLEHSQMLATPADSAWCAAGVPNGDLVVGGSDGRFYVWTTDSARKAPDNVTELVNLEIAQRVAKEIERKEAEGSQEVVIKVALDDGPAKLELRYKKGTDPAIAAEKFLQTNNLPASYLNEITEYIVANIPEARAAQNKSYRPQPTQRVTVDGEEYDFAFEVTTEDGRTLMLPYNAGEDTDLAAQRFCEKHNLPIKFMKQMSQLLRAQTSGVAAPSGSKAPGFYDPFTGSGRYVPGGSNDMSPVGGAGADPLTGGGRYVPGSGTSANASGKDSGDPFTSGGRYIPGSAQAAAVPNSCLPQDKKRPRGELIPLNNFFRFGVEQVSQKAIVKLHEVNESQSEERKLNKQQLEVLEKLMGADPGSLGEDEQVAISGLDLGMCWSVENLVPILDLFRFALLHPKINRHYCDVKTNGKELLQRLLALLVSDTSEPIRILVCRSLTNAMTHEWGREMALVEQSTTVEVVISQLIKGRPALQIAAASCLANWSLVLLQRSANVEELGPKEDVLRAVIKVFEQQSAFGDRDQTALLRFLQGVATLMWGDSQVIKLGKDRGMATIATRIKDAVVDERGKNLARDIVEMTYAV